jgi:hypothetical protein
MAMDFGFIAVSCGPRGRGQGDLVVELLESDLDRHIEVKRLGRLRAARSGNVYDGEIELISFGLGF